MSSYLLRLWMLALPLSLAVFGVGCNVPLDPDHDGDHYSRLRDCDDTDPSIHPGAPETCNGRDDDCDGRVDETGPDGTPPEGASTWYPDDDGDGFGDATASPVIACDAPPHHVADHTDCDDADAAAWPGAAEVCDGKDNDCDGQIDEDMGTVWYADGDGDGYGDPGSSQAACAPLEGYVEIAADCDDTRADTYPGAEEVCDGRDNDCDGSVPLEAARYADRDGDGFGSETDTACSGEGYIAVRGDCDDTAPAIHAGADDAADDGIDQDCGGTDGPDPHVGLSPASLSTLEEALDLTVDGQVVWVGPGYYLEHDLSFEGKAVRLASTHLAAATTVDALGQGRVFRIDSGEAEDSVLDGFTLTGGNVVGEDGGGILVDGSSPRITLCTVTGNQTTAVTYDVEPWYAGGRGGGIACTGGAPTITLTTLEDNLATGTDTVYGHGGGGYFGGCDLSLSGSTIQDNQVTGPDGGVGGGLCLYATRFSMYACTVRGNDSIPGDSTTYSGGGGIYVDTASGGIENTVIDENSAASQEDTSSWCGGGLLIFNSALTVDHCVITGNQAPQGGGVCILYGSLYQYDYDEVFITNSVLAYNDGFNLYYQEPYGDLSLVLRYTDLYSPAGRSHNLDTLDASNLTVDPGFILFDDDLAADDDYHPAPGSPLIDAGAPEVSDADGSRTDIGLYGGEVPPWQVWQDQDTDGLYDPWEVAYGLSAEAGDGDQDPDGDGLTSLEEQSLHTDPLQADSDQDGSADGVERAAGSDPLNRWSRPGGEVALRVPDEFPTLADALDAITTEGTIELAPGTWQEHLEIARKSVTLTGVEGQDRPVLEAAPLSLTASQATVRLEHLRFQGAEDSSSSLGAYFVNSKVTLEDAVFSLQRGVPASSDMMGCGVALRRSTTDVTASVFEQNGNGGIWAETSDPTISDSTFSDNGGAGMYLTRYARGTASFCRVQGNGAGGYGGFWADSERLDVEDTIFLENYGPDAAVTQTATGGRLTLERCRLERNTGGAVAELQGTVNISHCLIADNTTDDARGGAGIYVARAGGTISHAIITRNQATHPDARAGAVMLDEASPIVSHCVIVGNSAGSVGGLYSNEVYLTIDSTVLAYNEGYNLYSTATQLEVLWSDLYNADGPNYYLLALHPSNVTVEPGFLTYGEGGLPTDYHLALSSALIDEGDSSSQDPDGSRADPGIYGGQAGDEWDLDGDGVPGWFWPGSLEDAPDPFDPSDYDPDDLDPSVP